MDPQLPQDGDAATLEAKREKERVRKQNQRETRRKREGLITDKPRRAPAKMRQKLGELKEAVAPLGPGEASRQLRHAAEGAARLLRSDVEFEAHEFDDAGEAYADLSKVVWPLRLFIRVLIPLILVGALWSIGAKILAGTPWWQRRQEKKREKEEAKRGGFRVVQAPDGQASPYLAQPLPGITRTRKAPFPQG